MNEEQLNLLDQLHRVLADRLQDKVTQEIHALTCEHSGILQQAMHYAINAPEQFEPYVRSNL